MRLLVVALGLALACDNKRASEKLDPPPTITTSSMHTTAPSFEDVTWTMPAAWTSEPAGGMRKASYRAPKQPGDAEDATVSVVQAGGSVEDNVSRWKTQFEGAHDFARSELKVGGDVAVTLVELHGTYTGGGVMVGESAAARPGWALVGAIVPTGSQPYFFKMIGPDKTVAAERADFRALVDSVRPK